MNQNNTEHRNDDHSWLYESKPAKARRLGRELFNVVQEEASTFSRPEAMLMIVAILLHLTWSVIALVDGLGPAVISLMAAELVSLVALCWQWWRRVPPKGELG